MPLRIVEIYVTHPVKNAVVRYQVEQLVSGVWNKREHVDVNADTPQARRKFLLEMDERLIVEDISSAITVFDRDNMANKIVTEGLLVQPPAEETEYSSQDFGDRLL